MRRHITLFAFLVLLNPLLNHAQMIFSDGFESGSPCVWSAVLSLDPCDGQDNDCDGLTDEEADCSDGIECTIDSCSGISGCQSEVSPGHCLVAGICFDDGQLNPSNECQSCSVATDQTAWTNLLDGTSCNGFGYQCVNGVCDLVCFAAGTLVPTTDGLVPIERVHPGMLVPSYSPIDGTLSFRPVIAVDRRPTRPLVDLRVGGESIMVTPDHRFATATGGWVAARELRNGEALFNLDGNDVTVTSAQDAAVNKSSTPWVYNLRVNGPGTYFVGRSQVLVNSCVAPVDLVVQRRPSVRVQDGALLGDGFPMVIHNALAPNLSLVTSAPGTHNLDLPCFPVGRWSLLIGEHDAYIAILDNEDHSIKIISKEVLKEIAAGELACTVEEDLSTLRVPLQHDDVGFGGVIANERVYLSFFATRRVDVFSWTRTEESPLPAIRFERTIAIEANDRPGISSIALWKDQLWAADVNWVCETPNCDDRFGESRLFALDLLFRSRVMISPKSSALVNAGGLYLHEPSDSLYRIGAGNRTVGRSMVQRVRRGEAPGAPIVLPRGADAERGYRINDGVFAVLQLSGHNVFFIDATTDKLVAVQRFDGERFHEIPTSTTVIPDRSDAVLRQVIPDPGNHGRFYLVDSKGEQIIYVAYEPSSMGFRTLGRFPLGRPGRLTAPNWGVSLRE